MNTETLVQKLKDTLRNVDEDKKREAVKKAFSGILESGWSKTLKLVASALLGASLAVAAMLLNSCTITPAQAAQLQAVDAALHAYAPYIITIEPLKK